MVDRLYSKGNRKGSSMLRLRQDLASREAMGWYKDTMTRVIRRFWYS